MSFARAVAVALGGALVGWAVESVWTGELQRSVLFGGAPVPLLPVYGAGALVAVGLARAGLERATLPARALGYGAALTGLELAACQAERALLGSQSWRYRTGAFGGCVDLPHALVWSGLGLGVGAVAGSAA